MLSLSKKNLFKELVLGKHYHGVVAFCLDKQFFLVFSWVVHPVVGVHHVYLLISLDLFVQALNFYWDSLVLGVRKQFLSFSLNVVVVHS